jgi:hypothetical protein
MAEIDNSINFGNTSSLQIPLKDLSGGRPLSTQSLHMFTFETPLEETNPIATSVIHKYRNISIWAVWGLLVFLLLTQLYSYGNRN